MRFCPALILPLAAHLLWAAPPASPKAKRGPATVRPLTSAQLKVAHFLTEDGTLGFVLDRSQEPARLRFDKERDVIELTLEEDLRAGQRRGITYRRPDGRSVLYIDFAGAMQVFTAQGSLPVRSDRDAAPLPNATVTGQYRRPKTLYESAVEQLTPLTVMARFPGFRPEDSGNLEEVARAFERIDASMLVRINGAGSHNAQWAPASSRIGDTEQGLGGTFSPWPLEERAWDPKAKGLAGFGAILVDDRPEFDRPSRLRMMALRGWPAPLAADTPGILWSVLDGTLVFLSLDGGRYQIPLSGTDEHSGLPVTLGLAPEARWPQPLQHALLDVDSIRALAKGEAIPEKQAQDIEALDDGWFHCVNAVWRQVRTELDKAEALPEGEAEKAARLAGIKRGAPQRALREGEGAKARLEQGLVQFIEARNVQRMALFEGMRERVRRLLAGPGKK